MAQERYKNAKIYRIINTIDNEEYIGSTCKRLCQRLSGHKADAKTKGDIKVYKHLNEVGWQNVRIILIEEFPCSSKMELERQEAHWIRELKPSLNCRIPRRPHKEWREENKECLAEYRKEYYEKNKDVLVEKQKEYQQKNKESIAEYHKEYQQKNKEIITEKQKEYRQKNKDVLADKHKEYQQKNKEVLAEYQRKYQQKNREVLAEKSKAYYQRKKAENEGTQSA